MINFNYFAKFSRQRLFGIDLSINQSRIIEILSTPTTKELINFVSENIAGLDESAISNKIKEKFLGFKAKKPSVMLILPSHQAITKNIEIPSRDPDEIKEIINLQAGRHTPYAREEIVVDYIEIGTYRKSYTKILLVIVNRSVIKRQIDILEAADLRVNKVLLSCEGIGQYCWMSATSKVNPLLGILHVDYGYTDFSITLEGRPIFIRNIPVGAHHFLQNKEHYQNIFVEEVRRSLEVYQNEDIESVPANFMLVGAVGRIAEIEYVLQQSLKIPAKILPKNNQMLYLQNGIDFVDVTGEISCFHIAASLVSNKETRIYLVPEEIKVRRNIEEKGKEIVKTGVLIMAIVVFALMIFLTNIYIKTIYLGKISSRYSAIWEEAQNLEKKFVKIKMVRRHLKNRGQALQVLSELYQITPQEIYFYHVSMEGDGKISLKGIADVYSSVYNFVAFLEDSKVFRNVSSKYAGTRREGDKDIVDFEINCILETG